MDDIDIFEINEAFASQATYCVEKLGIPMEKVNLGQNRVLQNAAFSEISNESEETRRSSMKTEVFGLGGFFFHRK